MGAAVAEIPYRWLAGLGGGHPATPLLSAREKVLTWRPAPLCQLLYSDCERNWGGWGGVVRGEGPLRPRPWHVPRSSQPMGPRGPEPGTAGEPLGSRGREQLGWTFVSRPGLAGWRDVRPGGTRPLTPRGGGDQ